MIGLTFCECPGIESIPQYVCGEFCNGELEEGAFLTVVVTKAMSTTNLAGTCGEFADLCAHMLNASDCADDPLHEARCTEGASVTSHPSPSPALGSSVGVNEGMAGDEDDLGVT